MRRFNFIKNRKYAFGFSIILYVFFICMLITKGVGLDISFRGGTRIMIQTVSEVDPNKASDLVEDVIGKNAMASVMETYSSDGQNDETVYMLRIDIAGNEPLTQEEEDKVKEVLAKNFDVVINSPLNENSSIAPTVGREALRKAVIAVVISMVLILLYVSWRFRTIGGLSAAACGIMALLHDVGVMFGVYIVFGLPLNDIFVAAILTVIGYSINDTVIIYDRIRENTKLMPKSDLENIINVSIQQSIPRSINTLATTLIALVALLVFSVVNNIGSLIDFSFSLVIGTVTGAYSSIFIAAPLWHLWKERKVVVKKA